jgi:hypothetical protein
VHVVVHVVQQHNVLRSQRIFCRSSSNRIYRGSSSLWQAADTSGMHHCIHIQLSALAPSRRPSSNNQPIPPWSILRGNVSLGRSPASPARLLITSRDIQQCSGPSDHTTQSNKPPILPSVYIHSRRATPSDIPPKYTQRLDWVSGHHMTSISYLRRRGNTLTLLQASTCLRITDMHQLKK